jgi:hypothetical protein
LVTKTAVIVCWATEGQVLREGQAATAKKAMTEVFGAIDRARIAIEEGLGFNQVTIQ